MSLVIAPFAARTPTAPAVGIFWRVENALVIDRSTLDQAEPYGDCLTHSAGHYELWEAWRARGSANLAVAGYPIRIASTEYDDWPRGRIVYETAARPFVIYADRRLQTHEGVAEIKEAFGLADKRTTATVVSNDSHYR
jgi:hypothetical protein